MEQRFRVLDALVRLDDWAFRRWPALEAEDSGMTWKAVVAVGLVGVALGGFLLALGKPVGGFLVVFGLTWVVLGPLFIWLHHHR